VKNIQVRYGKESVVLRLPDYVQELSIQEPEVDIDKQAFMSSLDKLSGERAGSASGSFAIIVSDKTRLCGYQRILPWVTETLEKKGVASVSGDLKMWQTWRFENVNPSSSFSSKSNK